MDKLDEGARATGKYDLRCRKRHSTSERRGERHQQQRVQAIPAYLEFRLVSAAGSLYPTGGLGSPPADPSAHLMRGGKLRGLIVVRSFVIHYMY